MDIEDLKSWKTWYALEKNKCFVKLTPVSSSLPRVYLDRKNKE